MIESERPASGDRRGSAARRTALITALGLVQILMWGSIFYLLAVIGPAIVAETGWPERW